MRTAPQHEDRFGNTNDPHAEEARSAVSKHAGVFSHAHLNLSRRQTLAALGAVALSGLPRSARAEEPSVVLGSGVGPDGAFHAAGLDGALAERRGAALGVRVHALTLRPDGREAVAVGRRPQDLAFVLDGSGADLRATFRATGSRRFSGHGAYSADGRTFLSAEIDAESGQGFVVVRDVAGRYSPAREFASGGVGPHEIIAAGGLIAVANGAREPKAEPGIAALGRTRARSNVALLGPGGALDSVAEIEDGMETLSLRHLVATPDGGLVVGAQDAARGARDLPLVARVEGGRLRFLDAGYAVNARIGGSVGQLSLDASGRYLAASGPVGGVVAVFDLARDDLIGLVSAPDCCAVAADGTTGGFVAATGLGEALRIAAHEGGAAVVGRRASAMRWDNHLSARPRPA